MEKFKILSNYDCLVIMNNKEAFLTKGLTLEFDSPCVLSIYPTETNKNNISFKLNLFDNVDTNRYLVIENENTRTFYLTQGAVCENYIISTLEIDNDICKFEIGEKNICVCYKQYKKNIQLSSQFSSFKTGILANCCYILLTSQLEQNLILFNTNSGKVDLLTGDEIKIKNNNIIVNKNVDNFAKHIQEIEYTIFPEGLNVVFEKLSYQNGRPIVSTVSQTIPFAFLEAIQIGDFELASSYLSLSLKRQIDEVKLKEYFGKIQNFIPLDLNTYAIKTKNEKNIYKFTLLNNKITEIDNIK